MEYQARTRHPKVLEVGTASIRSGVVAVRGQCRGTARAERRRRRRDRKELTASERFSRRLYGSLSCARKRQGQRQPDAGEDVTIQKVGLTRAKEVAGLGTWSAVRNMEEKH